MLLGDRYGWRPLPAEIPSDEFEEIVAKVTPEERKLLCWDEEQPAGRKGWYRRDDNSVPAMYCLQPRTGEFVDYQVWEERVERPLHDILLRATAGMRLAAEERLKYIASATQQEISDGSLRVEDAAEHVFCFFRKITGLPEDRRAMDFLDLDGRGNPDREASEQLECLKDELRRLLPGNVYEYEAKWTGSGVTSDHLDQLCEDVYNSLSRVILEEIAQLEDVDPLEKEISAHQAFGEDRGRFFTGRAGILQMIGEYVKGMDRRPLAVWGEQRTPVIPAR